MSMSIYVMPSGRKYKFEDGHAPAEAVKVEKKAKKTANKARKTANKAKKVEEK